MSCNLDDMARFVAEATRHYQLLVSNPDLKLMNDERPVARVSNPALEKAWAHASEVFARGEIVTSIVTGWNRGGLLVRWEELQGFVPASQLHDVTVFECDEPRTDILPGWVGKELSLKIIELDKDRNRLVFSERATAWGPHDGDLLMAQIQPGDIRIGQVSNLCDFGAFVDLGGVDGLIHLSELAWRRITHPRDLLTIGQKVNVYVIGVDREHRRVALSLKRLTPNPWSLVDVKYSVGQDVDAVITNIVDFGAFAQIEDGLEGLIHISEFEKEVKHPSEAVYLGQQVRVRITRIDSANNRLGLSIKQAKPDDKGPHGHTKICP